MSFFQSIRSGLQALFHVSTVHEPPGDGETVTLEDIRTAMLRMAGPPTEASAILVRRIRYSADPQALWFLRSELMALLARKHGELVARTQLEMLSDMFRELLPSGLRSRPSPLLSAREERGDSLPHN
ncbi:MAG TPA: hypothetical protein VMZ74_11670 [Ramlibacter sp.]|nr:hypothetical protein [Ramlibacter sp.]